jgi:hypothetical protein
VRTTDAPVVAVTEAKLFWAPARTEEKISAPNSSIPHPKKIRCNFAPWLVIHTSSLAHLARSMCTPF